MPGERRGPEPKARSGRTVGSRGWREGDAWAWAERTIGSRGGAKAMRGRDEAVGWFRGGVKVMHRRGDAIDWFRGWSEGDEWAW